RARWARRRAPTSSRTRRRRTTGCSWRRSGADRSPWPASEGVVDEERDRRREDEEPAFEDEEQAGDDHHEEEREPDRVTEPLTEHQQGCCDGDPQRGHDPEAEREAPTMATAKRTAGAARSRRFAMHRGCALA